MYCITKVNVKTVLDHVISCQTASKCLFSEDDEDVITWLQYSRTYIFAGYHYFYCPQSTCNFKNLSCLQSLVDLIRY